MVPPENTPDADCILVPTAEEWNSREPLIPAGSSALVRVWVAAPPVVAKLEEEATGSYPARTWAQAVM